MDEMENPSSWTSVFDNDEPDVNFHTLGSILPAQAWSRGAENWGGIMFGQTLPLQGSVVDSASLSSLLVASSVIVIITNEIGWSSSSIVIKSPMMVLMKNSPVAPHHSVFGNDVHLVA